MENTIVITTTINTSADKVWDVLTNPDKIELYLFGSRCDSDWKPGSKANFYILQDERQINIVKGEVIRNVPGKLLEHTLFPAGADLNDSPENYVVITYELQEHDGETDLTTTQKGYKYVENGLERYIDSQKAWKIALPKLKQIAEKG